MTDQSVPGERVPGTPSSYTREQVVEIATAAVREYATQSEWQTSLDGYAERALAAFAPPAGVPPHEHKCAHGTERATRDCFALGHECVCGAICESGSTEWRIPAPTGVPPEQPGPTLEQCDIALSELVELATRRTERKAEEVVIAASGVVGLFNRLFSALAAAQQEIATLRAALKTVEAPE